MMEGIQPRCIRCHQAPARKRKQYYFCTECTTLLTLVGQIHREQRISAQEVLALLGTVVHQKGTLSLEKSIG